MSSNYMTQGDDNDAIHASIATSMEKAYRLNLDFYNEATGRMFGDNFTAEGIPVMSADDLEAVKTKYPVLDSFLDEISNNPYARKQEAEQQNPGEYDEVSPFYYRFIKMGKDGRLVSMPTDTVALRGEMYYFTESEMKKEVRESDSIKPAMDFTHENFNQLDYLMNAIRDDESIPDVIQDQKERIALASVLDHIRNYALLQFGSLLYIGHGREYPNLVKKYDPNNKTVKEMYHECIDEWISLNDDNLHAARFIDKNYNEMFGSISRIVSAYHNFLIDGKMDHWKKIKDSDMEMVRDGLVHVGNAVVGFEETVDEMVPKLEPEEGVTKRQLKHNKSSRDHIKRELFKKLLRHERDADHPGINMLHVAQTMLDKLPENDEYAPIDLVLGISYGGIEYPFVYRTVQEMLGRDTAHTHFGFMLLSNYNLGFTPSTAPLAERHLYPAIDGSNADRIVVFDDNAVTGKSALQAKTALQEINPDAQTTVACCDMNVDPRALKSPILGTLALGISGNTTRALLKRNTDADGTSRYPHFLNASRYTADNFPKR